MALIQVDNLSKQYGEKILFNNCSFSIEKGEKCALVGRNGEGKTTLFKMLLGLEHEDRGEIQIVKDYRIGYLEQHLSFHHEDILQEVMSAAQKEDKDKDYLAEKILFGLGFEQEDLKRSPKDFSGGYQLRINLAKVLVSDPDCLFLDEPTNYLDILSIRWLEEFLRKWSKELIIISHDQSFLNAVITHVIGIHRHNTPKIKGDTHKYYEHIALQDEIYEKTRQNLEKKQEKYEDYIRRFGAKATKASQAKSKEKALKKLGSLEKLISMQNLSFSFNEKPFFGKKFANITSIEFSYPDSNLEQKLISNFSCQIEKTDRIALIGKNGFGKSTLLKLIAQEIKPDNGYVSISRDISIGYFGQTNISRLNPNCTIEEEVTFSNTDLEISQVRSICGKMLFSGSDADKKIQVLSGGEKSRVLLAKIIAKPCNLLLLDEPTNHLDMESIEALIEALNDYSKAFIIVSHNEEILNRLNLTKLIVCHKNSQELFLGNYLEFLEKRGWDEENTEAIKENIQKKGTLLQNLSKEIRRKQQEMNKIEKNILSFERKIEEKSRSLEQATATNNVDEIAQLSTEIATLQKNIEKLFDDLERIETEIQSMKN
ncbi:MAG TPA: ATP-binding cassette domain-containing protein [Chlamydiales bacterium]|nr:ATP-binding cassette domain-containing protein [Chlamydiales bacterium]